MLLYYTTLNTDSDIVHVLDEVMANLKKTVYTELLVSELKLWQLQKYVHGCPSCMYVYELPESAHSEDRAWFPIPLNGGCNPLCLQKTWKRNTKDLDTPSGSWKSLSSYLLLPGFDPFAHHSYIPATGFQEFRFYYIDFSPQFDYFLASTLLGCVCFFEL
ncbi:hypothetical protein H671_1g0823 [Cricetulus griseus]|nr:hypothetical protein H671_1g0823 [Cricetulus griseus]